MLIYPDSDQVIQQLREQGQLDEDKCLIMQKKVKFLKIMPLIKTSLIIAVVIFLLGSCSIITDKNRTVSLLTIFSNIGITAIAAAFLIFLIHLWFYFVYTRRLYLYNMGDQTTGVVTKISFSFLTAPGFDKYSTACVERYQTRKVHYDYNSLSQWQILDKGARAITFPSAGDTITVYYDPNNPKDSAILDSTYKHLLIRKSL